MSDPPLRIGLNASALLFPLTGIGQYTKNLAEALVASGEIELHLFYVAAWSREIRTEPLKRLTKLKEFIKKVVPHPYAVSRFIQQVKFSQGARERRIALYHEPNFLAHSFPHPIVISAHDLSWIRFPETHPPERVAVMNRLFPRCLERADHIITDAAFIRDEVIAEFGIPPERVTSVPLAARRIFRPRTAPECDAVLSRHKLSYRNFLLCVGTLEPRKNLQLMIRAYAAMPDAFRRRFPLVLVGMKGWLTSAIDAVMQPLVSSGQVRALGFTSDEELAALYA
ncbi:MAG: glycosyltransferase family 4 protein, partial [Burkholderiaceae bacterium]